MLLVVGVMIVLAFCAGCVIGRHSAALDWRAARRMGWRLWHLGTVHELPSAGTPDWDLLRRAAMKERQVREKVPPRRSPPVS